MNKQVEMTPDLNSDGIFNDYLELIKKGEDQYFPLEEEGPKEKEEEPEKVFVAPEI